MQEILSQKPFYIEMFPKYFAGQPAELLGFDATISFGSQYCAIEVEDIKACYKDGQEENCTKQPNGAFRFLVPKTPLGQWNINIEIEYTLKSNVFEGGVRQSSDNFELPFKIVKRYSCEHQSRTMLKYPQVGGSSVLGFALVVDTIKGEKGENGVDGKSAYQNARDGGYSGTEEQFNQSLSNIHFVRYDLSQWQETGQRFKSPQGVLHNVKSCYIDLEVSSSKSGELQIPTSTRQPIISIKGHAREIKNNETIIHTITNLEVFTRWNDVTKDYNTYIIIPRTAPYGWNVRMSVEALFEIPKTN